MYRLCEHQLADLEACHVPSLKTFVGVLMESGETDEPPLCAAESCFESEQAWPCDTVILLAEVRRLQARVRQLEAQLAERDGR